MPILEPEMAAMRIGAPSFRQLSKSTRRAVSVVGCSRESALSSPLYASGIASGTIGSRNQEPRSI